MKAGNYFGPRRAFYSEALGALRARGVEKHLGSLSESDAMMLGLSAHHRSVGRPKVLGIRGFQLSSRFGIHAVLIPEVASRPGEIPVSWNPGICDDGIVRRLVFRAPSSTDLGETARRSPPPLEAETTTGRPTRTFVLLAEREESTLRFHTVQPLPSVVGPN